jgi:RNA polymerase sigma factor (sigma-70 family)
MITTDFVRKFEGLVKSIAHEYEKQPDKFEDLTQDIWLQVCRKADLLPKDEKAHSTWLTVVATNVCKHHIKNTTQGPELVMDSAMTPPAEEEETPGEGSWIEQSVPSGDRAESEQALTEFMMKVATLTEQENAIFNLVYWHGHSYSAVAKRLGIEEATVRSVTRNVRDKLESKEMYHEGAYTYHAPGAVWGDWAWKPDGVGNLRMENNNNVECNRSGPNRASL